MQKVNSVAQYIERHPDWSGQLVLLSDLLRQSGLEETIKWGAPCYTLKGKNLVGIGAFKSYVGLWFHQGALLADPAGKLINAQEGKTKALRQWRFKPGEELDADLISSYIQESIRLEQEGKRITPAPKTLSIPEELLAAFTERPDLQQKFEALSPGKQREYAEYVGEAKRADTRQRRIDKISPMIKEGKGLNDKYK